MINANTIVDMIKTLTCTDLNEFDVVRIEDIFDPDCYWYSIEGRLHGVDGIMTIHVTVTPDYIERLGLKEEGARIAK